MLFLAIGDQGAFEEGVSSAWVFLKEGGDLEVAIDVKLRLPVNLFKCNFLFATLKDRCSKWADFALLELQLA